MVKFLDNNSGFNQWKANQAAARPRSKFSSFLWWFVIFMTAWWVMGLFIKPNPNNDATTESVVIEDASAVPSMQIDADKIAMDVRGLRLSNIQLKDFLGDDKASPVAMFDCENCFAQIGLVATGTTAPTAGTVWQDNNGTYTWRNSDGVEYSRAISVDGYMIAITDTVKNNTSHDISIAPYVRMMRGGVKNQSSAVTTGALAYVNSELEHNDWRSLERKSYAYSTQNGFAGFADQYWEILASMARPDQTIRVKKVSDIYSIDMASAPVVVGAGKTDVFTTNIFAGPRDSAVLNAAASKIAGAPQTMDYGWFWFLAQPMLWLLNAINAIVMNYGVAIIIMTIILRMLMWPLTRKSYTSMIAMQKMQPEMARIQKLYANDKVRMQTEMMRLYQTHRTSPMSGCLPMLIQIPIFFALYKALLISVQMRNAHFLWISDLAAMDPYFILPILMGATMWWQQRLQSAANAKTTSPSDVAAKTQRAMKWMPLIFTIMFAWMPAGLVLYWTVSNLLGIMQIYILKKKI